MDLLQAGAERLAAVLRKSASRPVTYCRGTHRVAVHATVSRKVLDAITANGTVVTIERWDFLVAAEELAINGQKITPQPGDTLRETLGGVTRVYEVGNPVAGSDCYTFSDSSRIILRIHTKRIDTIT